MQEKPKRVSQPNNNRRVVALILIVVGAALLLINLNGFAIVGDIGRLVGQAGGSFGQALGDAASSFGTAVGNFFGSFGRTIGQIFGGLGQGIGQLAAHLWPLALIIVGLVMIFRRRPHRKSGHQAEWDEQESAY